MSEDVTSSQEESQDPKPRRGSRTGNAHLLPAGNPKRTGREKNGNQHTDNSEPTQKEIDFVRNYVITWNATKAAIAAGYSPDTAYSTGSKIAKYPRVQKLIKEHLDQVKEDHRQTHDAITAFLLRIIYADTTDLLKIEKDPISGKNVVNFKSSEAMESGAGMLIDSITVGRGGTIKIDIFSKQQALDMLNKHIGYYEIDNRQKVPTGPNIYMPDNGRGDMPG